MLVSLVLAAGACTHDRPDSERPTGAPAALPATPLPTYAEAAARYNQRLSSLTRLRARVNLLCTFTNDLGQPQTESPEGTLQYARPDRLALSLGKVGDTLLWIGCDQSSSWVFDLVSDDRSAVVGPHNLFEREAARRLGLPGRPIDQLLLLGITPLDPSVPGVVERGRNGLLGLSTLIAARGIQRVWIDPANDRPIMIELFDARKRPLLRARLSGDERIELSAAGGERPWIPARVEIESLTDGSTVRVTLSGATDRRISDQAFDFEAIARTYGVARIERLEVRPIPAQPGR